MTRGDTPYTESNNRPEGLRFQCMLSRTSSQWSFKSVRSRLSSFSSIDSDDSSEIEVTVKQIKRHVLRAFREEPHLFHPKDVAKVKKSDSFIQRFILDHQSNKKNNWEEILEAVLDSLKWRMEFGINEMDHRMFPKEFFDLKVFSLGQVGPKEFVLYMKARRFRKFDGLQERILQFMIYCFESKAEEFGDDVKITMFSDISGCGFSQIDIKLFMAAIPIFLKNYPAIAEHVYVYELPWVLKPFAKFIMSCLPAKFDKMLTFVSKHDYLDIVPFDKSPKELNGPVKTAPFEPADDAMSFDQVCQQLGMTNDQVKKSKKLIDEVLEEIKKEDRKSLSQG